MVFPLIVAITLATLRLVGEIGEAVRLADAAEYLHSVDAVVAVGAATTVVAGRQTAGTIVPEDKVPLIDAISRLDSARRTPGLPPVAAASMERMFKAAARLRDMDVRSLVSIDDLGEIQRTVTTSADTTVEALLRPMNSAEVTDHQHRLLDVWAAQRQIFAVAVGLVRVIRDPSDPGTELTAATGAETVLLDRLSRHYPSDDPRIGDLRASLAAQLPLIMRVRAAIPSGTEAVRAVGYGDALVHDLEVYSTLVAEAASVIVATVAARVSEARTAAVRDSIVLLITLVIGLAMTVVVGQALVRPLRRLHDSARRIAEVELPAEVERISTSDPDDVMVITSVPVDSEEEIGRLARAVDDIHGQALHLAGEQRRLRLMVNDLFDALARRTNSLLERQLQLIESLEGREEDPKRLASLFQLDHLATRMRRNGDNLLVLAGTHLSRTRSTPYPIRDVMQAAVSEVEHYQRVRASAPSDVAIMGAAVVDIVHLLAELLDNALRCSPPDSQVFMHCDRIRDGGLVIDIVDQGIGILATDLDVLNRRLAAPPEIEAETARRMGLYVVGRLAERHGISVRLRPTETDRLATGITAVIAVPAMLIRATGEVSGRPVLPDPEHIGRNELVVERGRFGT